MEILGGPMFGVAGAGESHGPGYMTLVFGCPPGLRLSRSAIQQYLDRRRPGSTRHGTSRREGDRVVLLSGLYAEPHEPLVAGPYIALTFAGPEDQVSVQTSTYEEGFTTGEPISALVLSASKRSRDYSQFTGPSGEVRPGHTDLVKHFQSRGFADVRGGARSSYRATISDVVGGAVARTYLADAFSTAFLSGVIQVGTLAASQTLADRFERLAVDRAAGGRVPLDEIREVEAALRRAPFPTLDPDFAREAVTLIESLRDEGDSIGAVVEVVGVNVPPLAGAPLYQSLKLRLLGSLGGINAARACEVGAGFAVAHRRGSENNDPIRSTGFQSNRHGGMLGGITTGMPLACRVSFKPTSSILKPQRSVNKQLEDVKFTLKKGRHDPCVGLRAGITLESRMAIELLNAVLTQQATQVDPEAFRLFEAGDA
jgi:chorismate synthase